METQAVAGERVMVDETALVAALRRGDREAFAAVVDANSPWMMRIALAHVSSRASAEDAVQEAWLRCLRGLDGFEGRSTLKSWLFVIVTNCARRRAERDSRSVPFSEVARHEAERVEPQPLEDRFFDDSHPRWPGGWTTFSRSWGRSRSTGCWPARCRRRSGRRPRACPAASAAAFLLRDVEGWSSEDVCDALGISGSNQRVLLHRARHAIRGVLEDYLEGGGR